MSRRAVFLDRDGVLNEAPVVDGLPRAPRSSAELRILAGAREGCRALAEAGLMLICITNQPEIARGTVRSADVEAINAILASELGLDEVVVCPHDDADDCDCRKPRPGLILAAAERHAIELATSVTVGDRWRDVEAGRSAGTLTVFIDRGYDEALTSAPDLVVAGLEEATGWIIRQSDRP